MSFKVFSIAAAVAFLVGCGSSHPAPKPVVAPTAPEPPRPMPSVVTEPTWTLDLQAANLWEKRSVSSGTLLKVEGNWITKKNFGEGPVVLTVTTTPVEVGLDPVGFIKSVIYEQDKDDNTRFFTVRKVKIDSGEIAGFASFARRTPSGVIGRVELVTSHGNNGFIVTCGGSLEDSDEWQELCVSVLSTFEIR